jgi:polyisoprenoid-binding protein YceI
MGIADGTYRLGPHAGRLVARTSRTGLGAKVGHDLTIEVGRWFGTATVDLGAPANSSVSVGIDVDSFEVRDGTGGITPLTDSDRADIRKTIRDRILRTAQHPTMTFRSTRIGGSPESFTVEGELTIMGVTRPITVHGRATEGGVAGTASVVQTRWGIRPYSAFFGALKLRDEVEVSFDLALAPD